MLRLVEVKRVNRLRRIDVRQRRDVDEIQQGVELVGDVPQFDPGALQIETGRQIPIVDPRLQARVPGHGRFRSTIFARSAATAAVAAQVFAPRATRERVMSSV